MRGHRLAALCGSPRAVRTTSGCDFCTVLTYLSNHLVETNSSVDCYTAPTDLISETHAAHGSPHTPARHCGSIDDNVVVIIIEIIGVSIIIIIIIMLSITIVLLL